MSERIFTKWFTIWNKVMFYYIHNTYIIHAYIVFICIILLLLLLLFFTVFKLKQLFYFICFFFFLRHKSIRLKEWKSILNIANKNCVETKITKIFPFGYFIGTRASITVVVDMNWVRLLKIDKTFQLNTWRWNMFGWRYLKENCDFWKSYWT